MEKNKAVPIGVLLLVVGFGIGHISGIKSTSPLKVAPSDVSDSVSGPQSMNDMMLAMQANLLGKTGDEFDRVFLDEMIMHHQGAVQMAEAARGSAGHQEIKEMAEDIISAQNQEINQMRQWQMEWYGTNSNLNHDMRSHQ